MRNIGSIIFTLFLGLQVHAQSVVDEATLLLNDPQFLQKAQSVMKPSEEKDKECKLYEEKTKGASSYVWHGLYRIVSQHYYGDLKQLKTSTDVQFPDYLNSLPEIDPAANDSTLKRYEIFGQKSTLDYVQTLAGDVRHSFNVPLTVTRLTMDSSQIEDVSHCSHRSGLSMDIRLLPGTKPAVWQKTDENGKYYDQKMNRTLILHLARSPQVKIIFFNDPELLSDPEIRKAVSNRAGSTRPVLFDNYPGHDNHIHVELYADEQMSLLTEEIKSRLQASMPTNATTGSSDSQNSGIH